MEGFVRQLSSVDHRLVYSLQLIWTWHDLTYINKVIEINVPKQLVDHSRCQPWAVHELRNSHKEKMKSHRRAKRACTKTAWVHYHQLRNERNNICKSKYVCFINELGDCTTENPKKCWSSFFKTKSGQRSSFPARADITFRGILQTLPAVGSHNHFRVTIITFNSFLFAI